VVRFRGFGERRAVTLLLCLGIFRLQDKSAFMSRGLRHGVRSLDALAVSRAGTRIRAGSSAPPGSRVSRPTELHRRPLAEPSVRLSLHSAPIR
jgi:hypothetical protein